MPEGAEQTAAVVPHRFIRNPQDFYGGLALIGLAAFAFWASGDLPGMRGFAFGPGTAPRLFAGVLAAFGLAVLVNGLIFHGPAVERYDITAPLLIIGGYVLYQFGRSNATQIAAAVFGLLGAAYAVWGLMGSRRTLVRGPLLITVSIMFFAIFVRPLGLVVTSFLTMMICAAASPEVRWGESVIVSICLTIFCAILFPTVLNLPMPLWPQWFANLLATFKF